MPLLYAGQYTDSESGLQYLRARYYDPHTNQFLTVDLMVGMEGEPYAYTAGNPLNGVDPYGLWCVGPVCSDQVGHILGQIGNNAGTIVPIAVYTGVVVGTAACAYFALGVCVAADVALGGTLFVGGGVLANALMPPGEVVIGSNEGTAEESCDSINLANAARTSHILQGDKTGGGHLWPGSGGKTPFPRDWWASQIMHRVSDVATDPSSIRKGNLITGSRAGVDIRVVMKHGQIWTAYPLNRPRNP